MAVRGQMEGKRMGGGWQPLPSLVIQWKIANWWVDPAFLSVFI